MVKRRSRADHDWSLAERIRRQVDHRSVHFEPKVADSGLGAGQDAAQQLWAAEYGAVRPAREVPREQSTRHSARSLRKVGERARHPLGARCLDCVAKSGRQLSQRP
jgi:hypothetical protein